jgi:hypothetical protein
MRTGGAFPRQGHFPGDASLGRALALLEQRAADKFDALDRNDGDVVGKWIALTGLGLSPSTLGNGHITGQWRRIGLNNAGFRILIQVGTTTAFTAFGFQVFPPPQLIFDTNAMQFPLSGTTAPFPVTMGGFIGGAFTGRGTAGVMDTSGTVLILGAGVAALIAGDFVLFEFELPTKKAS